MIGADPAQRASSTHECLRDRPDSLIWSGGPVALVISDALAPGAGERENQLPSARPSHTCRGGRYRVESRVDRGDGRPVVDLGAVRQLPRMSSLTRRPLDPRRRCSMQNPRRILLRPRVRCRCSDSTTMERGWSRGRGSRHQRRRAPAGPGPTDGQPCPRPTRRSTSASTASTCATPLRRWCAVNLTSPARRSHRHGHRPTIPTAYAVNVVATREIAALPPTSAHACTSPRTRCSPAHRQLLENDEPEPFRTTARRSSAAGCPPALEDHSWCARTSSAGRDRSQVGARFCQPLRDGQNVRGYPTSSSSIYVRALSRSGCWARRGRRSTSRRATLPKYDYGILVAEQSA